MSNERIDLGETLDSKLTSLGSDAGSSERRAWLSQFVDEYGSVGKTQGRTEVTRYTKAYSKLSDVDANDVAVFKFQMEKKLNLV